MSAKAERIAHGIPDMALFSLPECIIQIQFVLDGCGVSRQVDKTVPVDLVELMEIFSAASPKAYLIARVS